MHVLHDGRADTYLTCTRARMHIFDHSPCFAHSPKHPALMSNDPTAFRSALMFSTFEFCMQHALCLCVASGGMSITRILNHLTSQPLIFSIRPGPQHYQTLWKTSSKKKRSPSFGFGTEARSSSFLYS